jgi:hypothetical protein
MRWDRGFPSCDSGLDFLWSTRARNDHAFCAGKEDPTASIVRIV